MGAIGLISRRFCTCGGVIRCVHSVREHAARVYSGCIAIVCDAYLRLHSTAAVPRLALHIDGTFRLNLIEPQQCQCGETRLFLLSKVSGLLLHAATDYSASAPSLSRTTTPTYMISQHNIHPSSSQRQPWLSRAYLGKVTQLSFGPTVSSAPN